MVEIPITFKYDEKGYFDRECPNCEYCFKVNIDDLQEKIFNNTAYCPMCGIAANGDEWFTQTQLDSIRDIAKNWAISYVHEQLGKAFSKLERATRNNSFCRFEYKSDKIITFVNNPIGQMKEWKNDITCSKCGTRYSVIGSAYFCPCCGNNSVEENFDNSIKTIKRMIKSIDSFDALSHSEFSKDDLANIKRGLLENALQNIVSAFQKIAQSKYNKVTGKTEKVNTFQIISKGNVLYESIVTNGYLYWINNDELEFMNLMFNRRHLLEHNFGMIDDKYIEKTNDNMYKVGQRIVIYSSDLDKILNIVIKVTDGIKGV